MTSDKNSNDVDSIEKTAGDQVSYSQWGDDLLVLDYFREIKDGVFFEAGANDPVSLSQTYLLEKHGWKGILVEPVPACCQRLRLLRTNSVIFQNALGAPNHRGKLKMRIPENFSELAHAIVDPNNLANTERFSNIATEAERRLESANGDQIIEAEFITIMECVAASGLGKIDYLSLDLEGFELYALTGLDFKAIRPGLIIIEDRLDDLSRHSFLRNKHYKLVKRNGSNNWYVPCSTVYPMTLIVRVCLFRKVYLSIPFRWLRDSLRKFRKYAFSNQSLI